MNDKVKIRPLTEGYVNKGGINKNPQAQVPVRPAPAKPYPKSQACYPEPPKK